MQEKALEGADYCLSAVIPSWDPVTLLVQIHPCGEAAQAYAELPKRHCCRERTVVCGLCVPHVACRHRFPKITQTASLEKQTKQLIKMKLYRKRSQTECSLGSALGRRLCPSGLAFTERESDTVAGKRGDLGK